jgi:hypothetical protein
LPIISKYWTSWISGAFASVKVGTMLSPSNGACADAVDDGRLRQPATSSTVLATSITWWNWSRISPLALIPLGQWTIVPLRVPPQCEATCLVHW